MSQAGKGHVPEENLIEYRRLAGVARRFDSLANTVSNMGDNESAYYMWAMKGRYWDQANALRVDLPTK